MQTTVAAIASATGGAIAVIRVSGPDTLQILKRCSKRKHFEHSVMTYCRIFDANDRVLDDVMAVFYRAPKSYTGEDSAEIFTHGGALVCHRVLDALFASGCEPAPGGEFTKRAFLNGKLDLSQAEAVMSLICAKSDEAAQAALQQLSGSVSKPVEYLRSELLKALVWVESYIDFAEEEIPDFPTQEVLCIFDRVLYRVQSLKRAHDNARLEGYRVIFLGAPNAGKSSIFNRLLGRDRSIVTDIAGTTTDLIEEGVRIRNVDLKLIDAAGLTESNNVIEKIGVERAIKVAENADAVVYVSDKTKNMLPQPEIVELLSAFAKRGRCICVMNKSDLDPSFGEPGVPYSRLCVVSAKLGDGLSDLEYALASIFASEEEEREALISSARQFALLLKAESAVSAARDELAAGVPFEFTAQNLREAVEALAEITGAVASDDVLNEIFSSFCIGK